VHSAIFRVYYEDTDAGGVVYHANYLQFMERARTEWLRSQSLSHQLLLQEHGLAFVVSNADIAFKQPARLDDEVVVSSEVVQHSRVKMKLRQNLYIIKGENKAKGMFLQENLSASAEVSLVVVKLDTEKPSENNSTKMRPKPLPQKLYDRLLS
jgi:tol-pal system-associated acyl-CoA thioesterase